MSTHSAESLVSPSTPSTARISVPYRSSQERNPASMGDDGYINYPTNVPAPIRPSRRTSNSISSEHSTNSLAGLRSRGAPVPIGGPVVADEPFSGVGSGINRNNIVARPEDGVQAGQNMLPGTPIGLLAARGTPYAKKSLFKSRKCRILCPLLGLIFLIIAVVITIFPVLRAVANHTLHTSVLSISASNITSPTNSSFGLTLEGQVYKASIFPAHLSFQDPIQVYWIAPEDLSNELNLGQFELATIGVANGHGRVKQETFFNITNQDAFGRFTEYLITQEQFTWRLKSSNVKAKAFGFIPANGLTFTKDLTLPGMANMTDVSISDFQLPGDDPAGGITLAVVTQFTNPSAFGVEIGSLVVDLFYGDLYLGPASTTVPINLTAGVNSIPLTGRLIDHSSDSAALIQLSTLFSNYINGIVTPVTARGVSATLVGGEKIEWLSRGIAALVLSVPLVSPSPIHPINAIDIQALSLNFDPANSWAPMANSSHLSARFGLPFGFSLSIDQLADSFSIVDNKTITASLSAPMGQAHTTILTRNAAYTTGSILLDLPLAPLIIGPSEDEHLEFSQFTTDLTITNGSAFFLVGNTTAITNTPIGQVELVIGFTVPAGLIGLSGLSSFPTEIVSVDVVGGTNDFIVLNLTVGLTNPSNLDFMIGDITFQLYGGEGMKEYLGTTIIPELHLATGYQEVGAIGHFEANNNPTALRILTEYAQGSDNVLGISGFNGSTPIESLTQAFMSLHLNATLVGLSKKLLNYANVTVLPTTGVTNDLATSVVSIQNPFSAPLRITNIQSNVTSNGFFVGTIIVDTDFTSQGHVGTVSPALAFNLNLYPPDIFALLRSLVVQTGQDTAPLDGIVQLGGYKYTEPNSTIVTGSHNQSKRALEEDEYLNLLVSPAKEVRLPDQADLSERMITLESSDRRSIVKRGIYTGFDLPSYVLRAFQGLTVNVDLVTVLHIDQFTTDLIYSQSDVPAHTDSSLTLLLPILARPIVQKIVDEAVLGITSVMISNPTNTAFTTGLSGSITNSGPFDASINFPQGLTVAWNGAPLGQIAMPNVGLVADVGATLDITTAFAVSNVDHLSDFTGYLLTQPSFTWQIYGQNLTITALGIAIDGISISKNVVLDGMNSFAGLVKINEFNLPANDPAGGVTLQLGTTLTNPASVGISLSTIGFENYFGATNIGPASSAGEFVLTPKATISLPLSGRLVPQTSESGLADVSTIFNGYIHGVPSNIIVAGANAGPADCVWLNAGIKKLSIAVVLPAAQNLQVIDSIALNQLTLMFNASTPWQPNFSTDNTLAAFQLPFAFPVDITQIETAITISNTGARAASSRLAKRAGSDFALLNVPQIPSKTDVVARKLLLAFENAPFTSLSNDLFSQFLLETTQGTMMNMGLHGSANTVTSTAIGSLNLAAIPFAVDSSLLGLQGLNARPATVSELDVARGYSDYLQINVNAHLYNPSNITIGTGDVAFDLSFNGQTIGTAVIPGLILSPGENVIATQVHYQPSGDAPLASGQLLLENFVQGTPSDTLIIGSQSTTPIASLQAALGSIKLATTIPPIHQNLITQAALTFPLDIGSTGIANANFVLGNPFTAAINLISVITNATYQGINLGEINQQNLNPPINAPGHTSITSPVLPLALNTDPRVLIQFLELAARAQGVDLGILLPQFAYALSQPETPSSITTSVNPNPETCTPTGTTELVKNLILAAVKNLRTNLTIQSTVALDEYHTPLNFVQNDVVTVLDDSVIRLSGIIGKGIVANIVTGAELSFTSGFISNLTDGGFSAALKGSLLNVGPFDALIEFPAEGVEVIWDGSHIANIALPPICSAGGSGVPSLDIIGQLTITDQTRFTDFATAILLTPSFTWNIATNNLRVYALDTIFDNVTLTKNVSFSAFNGLPGVSIINPDFPGDAPNGIELVTDSLIPSPSNLGIELGHATFIASFQGEEVGPIDAFNLVLAPLATTSVHLTGTIIKRTSASSTASLGVLFSQFLAGVNQTLSIAGQEIVSPAQPNSPITWLSAAFKKLILPVVLPGHVYQVISSVTIKDLTVSITSQSEAYSVPTKNNETDVVYKNPFGFSLTAKQAGGSFIISAGGYDVGVLNLPVTDVVSAQTSTGQNANLVLDWKTNEILQSLNNQAFNGFFNAITNTKDVGFGLHGAANVTAGTNAGDIPITGIPFNVSTDILGLQSLNSRPTIVSNLDVYHGYPTYLQINADASLYNPSPITIITNNVVFGLSFQGQVIGSVVLGDLLLAPGTNDLATAVHYSPSGSASTIAGEALLANYVQGITSNVSIVGTPDSSPYGSLQEALGTISIQTSIPPLHQALITEATITFPIDIATTGIAQATFGLSNPFTASVNLIDIITNATYETFFLGSINSQNLSPEISAGGHQNITSRQLPFILTTDPKFLIQFLEAAARAQGVDLGILLPEFAYVLSQPSTNTTVTSTFNTGKETCSPTGTTALVDGLILAAVKNLQTNLGIATTLRLDDYQTNLNFAQNGVPTVLDNSVLYLTGLIGKTIVANIVDQTALAFTGGSVTNVTDNGFTVALVGSLLNAGPFDALIEFPYGLDVNWEGHNIANLVLPPICSAGGSGVPDLQTTAILQITDLAQFTNFASYILNNPAFTWIVSTPRLRVSALGTIFDNVVLSKNVTFEAFNKLAGLSISNPNFPGDAPNGIELTVDSLVPSPSNLGIVLGDVTFIASFMGQQVGPVTGKALTLPAHSVTAVPLAGKIVATTSQPNLDALGVLFSQFLAGQNSTLTVTGDNVVSPAQPGSPVTWLSAAFKTLVLQVSLPGHVYEVISKIQLMDLTVFIQNDGQALAPLVTNNRTNVVYKNPFGFSLTAIQAGGDFIINYQGVDAGLLTVPVENSVSAETSTGNDANLVINILTPAVLSSLNTAAFESFFTAVTNTNNVAFGLHGGANVTAQTKAGNIPIGGIQFSVQTTFPGVNGFNHMATIPATPVVIGGGGGYEFAPTSGGSDFLRITLDVILGNPAPLILHTNLVSFIILYRETNVGRAYINPLDLMSGSNTVHAEFHYQPADAGNQVAEDLLTQYLSTTGAIPITVQGDTTSSPYGSLQEALSEITIPTSFPGQGKPLIHDLIIYLDLVQAVCGYSSFSTSIVNNLDTPLGVLALTGTASQNGQEYASFDYTFNSPLVAQPNGQPSDQSEHVANVKLVQGVFKSLPLLFGKTLDTVLTTKVDIGGYIAPSVQYSQNAVPYSLNISVGAIQLDAQELAFIKAAPVLFLEQLFGALGKIIECLIDPASGIPKPQVIPTTDPTFQSVFGTLPRFIAGALAPGYSPPPNSTTSANSTIASSTSLASSASTSSISITPSAITSSASTSSTSGSSTIVASTVPSSTTTPSASTSSPAVSTPSTSAAPLVLSSTAVAIASSSSV